MKKQNLKTLISKLLATEDKPNIETLAKSCYTSTMQLQRDFYNITGYSANEYIRRMRLSNALCLIKSSDRTLSDIAYSCGYSSQQAFCREIKIILSTTATEYREGSEYYFLSALNDDIPFQIEVSKITIPETVSLRYFSPMLRGIENNAVSMFLKSNPNYGGRIFGRNGKQQGSMLCYELYVEGENDLNIDGFELGNKQQEYEAIFAQTRVKNIKDEINAAWDYLYSSWLPVSMFDYAGQSNSNFEHKFFEEYYCKSFHPQRIKLYLPITRKKGLLKISIEKIPSMCFLISRRKGHNAEKEASRDVVEYLSKHYPYIIKNSKEFFFRQQDDCFTCGVKINTDLTANKGLHIEKSENQSFAVLYLSGISNYFHSVEMLTSWLSENSFITSGEPFAVYDTEKSYESPQMKIYCPIKVC